MLLGSSLFFLSPVAAAPGDLVAPVYSDGDWWNATWEGDHILLGQAGEYEIEFEEAEGWLKFVVGGTTSHLGKVAWVMEVTGKVRFTGDWKGDSEVGTTTLDATVSGTEYRSTEDLALLGSSTSYSGEVEIATMTGPKHYDMTVWENITLNRPFRLLLLPVPIATLPYENQSVSIMHNYESGTFVAQRQVRWDYNSAYIGLDSVQGKDITFSDQHTFHVRGNVTEGEERSPVDLKVYFEKTPRKAVTVDRIRDLEIGTYQVSVAAPHPDLVVADGEFNVTDYEPTSGKEVNFTGTVHNLGNRDVLSIVVELWASLDEDRAERQNSTTLDDIPANGKRVVHFNWSSEDVGLWTFYLRIDPTNSITENREDNNEAELQLLVKHDIPLPNLYVVEEGIVFDPPSPVTNRTAITITVTVGNDGVGIAENVSVDLYLGEPGQNGTIIGWRDTIDTIPPGETRKAWINWGANAPGNQVIWVYVDANNTVLESVETDNTGSAPLTIVGTPSGEVDLVVSSIKILDINGLSIPPYPKGEKVIIRVTVSNIEKKKASRVHMSVYVDTEDPQGLVGSHEGPIDGKGLVSWEVPWTVDRDDGDHEVIVTVVALGDVEATYKDNVDTLEFQVGPRSYPDPEPLDVTIFPDSTVVKPGDVIQVSGKVTLVKNGFEVEGATVYVTLRGEDGHVEVVTNELGRYLANVTMPNSPGNYRLEAQVRKDLSEGDNAITIEVEKEPTNGPENNGDDGPSMTFFIAGLVVLLAVLMPVTYYILVSKAEIRRRIRRVHEEIVVIEEEEEEK
jgi:hypothetical protein